VIIRAIITPTTAIPVVLVIALTRRLGLACFAGTTLNRQVVLTLLQLLTIQLTLLILLLLELLLLLALRLTLLNLLLLDLLLLLTVDVANLLLLLPFDLTLLVLLLLNLLLLLAFNVPDLLILLALDPALLLDLLLLQILLLALLHLLRSIGLLALLTRARAATDLITWRFIPSQCLSTDAYP
jgi:hypothetical protein